MSIDSSNHNTLYLMQTRSGMCVTGGLGLYVRKMVSVRISRLDVGRITLPRTVILSTYACMHVC